jgi:hypothetical protein
MIPQDLFDDMKTSLDFVNVPGQKYLSIWADCENYTQFYHAWDQAGRPEVEEHDVETICFTVERGAIDNGAIRVYFGKSETSMSLWEEFLRLKEEVVPLLKAVK